MAYNYAGLEEQQNWFSARYTASPYRKHKFPLDSNSNSNTDTNTSSPPWPNNNGRYTSTTNPTTVDSLPPGFPVQYHNTTFVNGPYNHYLQQQQNQSLYRVNLPVSHQLQYSASCGNSQSNDHHHYGLPIPINHNNGIPSSTNSHCFFRHPPQYRNFNNSTGVVDEGYIEDLKQPASIGATVSCSSSVGGNNNSYDPYSYVYDSKLQELSLANENPSIDTTVKSGMIPAHYNNNCVGDSLGISSCHHKQHSENEYEEISDVARYMNQGNLSMSLSDCTTPISSNGLPQGPKHFKSFSSTDQDILAEVVQVKQRHDRVLDQLDLGVENLLIRSSTEIESNHDVAHEIHDDKEKAKSENEINNEANDYNYYSKFLSGNNTTKQQHFSHSYGNIGTCQLGPGVVCTTNCCSTCICSQSQDQCCKPIKCNNKACGSCIDSFDTNNQFTSFTLTNGFRHYNNGDSDFLKGNFTSTLSSGRKKKLDRQLQYPFSDTCSSSSSNNGNKSNGQILNNSGGAKIKGRYHRSYSLIPRWKIREHLMRLPFLKQHDKLKKAEVCCSATIPISSSGQEFPNPSSARSGCSKIDLIGYNTTAIASMTTATKNRSSSVDELRTTTEEHWYSADSDTENDSITDTAIPVTSVSTTNTTNSANNIVGSATLTNNSEVSKRNHLVGSALENGSRLDIGNVIPDVPKAPKFRRGSGIKDKFRESWSQSKTLSKFNMDEEHGLLRWFSLRKNQTSLDGGGNRHSTLPQLSEEDLKRISFLEDEEGYWPRRNVQPPSLPPPKSDLTPNQVTRRHIVAAIVHSENSYVAALQRLVNEYKKPLQCSHPAILSHSKLITIFHRVPEILQCHSLFRIALAECVRKWDSDEKIGDVFVASFSKSLVLDVYSEFINNFGNAMETAKQETRRKSAFADFLKVKQMTAHDRLSLFGLMVKPVQRFPQFILLMQDLIKHTPKDHHDRMSLQLALTQLESLAAMLNERKRESEQYQAFKETMKSIGGGKFVILRSVADDPNRILLRQDIMTQLEFDSSGATVTKSKCRKLLLLNDMLICVSSQPSSSSKNDQDATHENNINSSSSSKNEKCVFKWSYPITSVEVEDISISPTMSRFVSSKTASLKSSASGGMGFSSSLPEETTNSNVSMSLLEEMQCLMHDYEVLSRILTLVSCLKSSYDGLTEASVKELMLEIQYQIKCRDEQISYFDSSCLTLLLGSGSSREKIVFQMQSPAAKNDWVEELRLAQLALDPNNSPAWDLPAESPYPLHKLPLFVKNLPLSKMPQLTTVKCGCFFTHTFVSPTGRSKILDYLWVSSTDGMSSHVSAFRSQHNTLKEISSFDLMEEKVNDLLFVMSHVWVATESRKIMVFDPSEPDKGHVRQTLLSDSVTKLTMFGSNVYAGLADGNLAVFTQVQATLDLKPDYIIKVGTEKITSVFGTREHVYAACGNSCVIIAAKTHTIERNVVLTHHNGPISHMACSGVGLWITTKDSGTICLYHLESLQHLQDVSIAGSVFRTVRDSFRRQKGCYVTCLIAHKGWLWIGTNLGVVLTIPLPRLEGVPIIATGKANVSYHGYCGPVTFLMPLTKQPIMPLHSSRNKSTANNPVDNITISNTSANAMTQQTPVSLNKNDINENTSDVSPNQTLVNTPRVSTNVSFIDKEENSSDMSNNSSPPGKDENIPNGTVSSSGSTASHNSSKGSSDGSEHSSSSLNKTLVVLRKKNSRDNVFLRNCKTLPRGGPIPTNLRFSIDSDVYGLYGNLINVRGLEDEGRFVDPLYDALRRSDPELNALDAKISTLDRRLKMRLSRPRSLDL